MNNNISFTGLTLVNCDPKHFRRVYDNFTSITHSHLNRENKRRLCVGPIFSTTAEQDSFVILLKNEKNGIFRKCSIKNINETLKEIAIAIEELKAKSKEKLTAWIIGGQEGCPATTTRALNKFADLLCDRPDIDTSLLVGMKKPEENLVIYNRKYSTKLVFEKPEGTDIAKDFDIAELNNIEYV